MAAAESYHAIYFVLNGSDFFPASLRSVYPHITGATLVTSYDRDRFGDGVRPDGTVDAVLSRELDPEGKVNVVVCNEGSEAALRNRAMAFVCPPAGARAFSTDEPTFDVLPRPDWFWIVDADEIYDDEAVRRLKAYVRAHPASAYEAGSYSYWRSWNWRIEQRDHRVILVRPGRWFVHLRHLHLSVRARAARRLRRLGVLPSRLEGGLVGSLPIPRDVVVFHHGDFVGDRDRIATKLDRSGHRSQFVAGWLDRVWDQWTPEMRDLHPFEPSMFPSASYVPTASLPLEIRGQQWPAGWLDDA